MDFVKDQKFYGQSIFDGSLYLKDTSTVMFQGPNKEVIIADPSGTKVLNKVTSLLEVDLNDANVINLNCDNKNVILVNWSTNKSDVSLNLINFERKNSTLNFAIQKTTTGNTVIILDGSSLSFRGHNDASLVSTPHLTLSSSEATSFWEFNILRTNLTVDSSTICFVAGPGNLT